MTHPLIDQVQAALRRLAEAPPAAEAANNAMHELTDAWSRGNLSAGIGGDLQARTELFNFLYGDKLFDPFARVVGSAAIRARRGPSTVIRIVRDDGSSEELIPPPDTRAEEAAARARADAMRTEVARRETSLVRIDHSVPALARKRPAPWAIWMWPLFWLFSWIARHKLAERKLADLAVSESRDQLAAVDRDTGEILGAAHRVRDKFVSAVRSCAAMGANNVRELQLVLAGGPLPDRIEILELTGPSRAEAEIDAVLLVRPDGVYAPGRDQPIPLGPVEVAISVLPSVLAAARALSIARRFRRKIEGALRALDDSLRRKEDAFRGRIVALEGKRMRDPQGFIQAQLDRVRPQIFASVQAVMEHASVHLGSELAQLQAEWINGIAEALTADELKLKVAKVTEHWDASPRRIGEEVRVLVMGGLGGSARDIYPDLVAPLVPWGLPAEFARPLRSAPVLPRLELLPSLTGETKSKLDLPGWLSGLFRSLEKRRTEVREKAHDRVEKLQERSTAELRDAEPRMHALLRDVLAGLLGNTIEHQRASVESAISAEYAAIVRERDALEPLMRARDAVRVELETLASLIAELERTQPAVAIAASAAETASLSR